MSQFTRKSNEGFAWTPHQATNGLFTAAVTDSTPDLKDDYDVVVIGAGFSGLVAARDISRHARVLLLDARDRIGGRTWTASVFGEELEMGGTWVHWNQPHVYTEIHRYGLQKNLKISTGAVAGDAVYYNHAGNAKKMNPQEFDDRSNAVTDAFFNIDGLKLQDYLPRPHEPLRHPELYAKYDKLSVQDRLDQLEFSDEDKSFMATLAGGFGLSHPRDVGFMEAANWFALVGGTNPGINEHCSKYKLGEGGTTSLARAIFEDFSGDFASNSIVAKIFQSSAEVMITLKDGRAIHSRYCVSTIPLNVLKKVDFDPPLSQLKREASDIGMVTLGSKYHFQFSDKQPPFFAGASPQSAFGFSFSDHDTPSGQTLAIGFGNTGHVKEFRNAQEVIGSYQKLFPHRINLQGYAIHDWRTDPFAESAWCTFRPSFASKYLKSLQESHGRRLFMASADWADGWRGFIDGAIEQGTRNAVSVIGLLRKGEESRARL
ncbi:hypothetical protein N7494_000389 [Penicillium frequentans]|uniref:Amine oxidase n=1 Tax=Penicillium frequentans TaxID=3151616 RepID=A0AAD6GIX6_9EURO|nr:hypothetical protein N7494_000389 [Penicillium glabrum]